MFQSQFMPQQESSFVYPNIPAENPGSGASGFFDPGQVDFYQGGPSSSGGGSGPQGSGAYTHLNDPNIGTGFIPDTTGFSGEIGADGGVAPGSSGFLPEDEPPLLEELGIDVKAILEQTKAICFPTSFRLQPAAEGNADLAGPLLFCLMLGTALLLRGKVHFGYIYGLGVTGCVGMWMVLNLMSHESTRNGISFDQTSSVLGYSLLPIVVLAFKTLFIDLTGSVGLLLIGFYVSWCTFSATRFIEQHLGMRSQRWLVAYPVWLLYAVFALVTVF